MSLGRVTRVGLATAIMALGLAGVAPSSASAVTGVHVVGGAIQAPVAISSDGRHVWVADNENTIEEVGTAHGVVGTLLFSTADGLHNPIAIDSDGTDVWVMNGNNTVTELSATDGSLVRVISAPSFNFESDDVGGIVSDGTDVWVVDFDDAVTELDAATGATVRVISVAPGPDSGDGSNAVALHSGDLWITNEDTNFVTEVDASTGGVVRIIDAKADDFDGLCSVAAFGSDIWVLGQDAVTEVDASSGALVRVVSGSQYDFNFPTQVSVDASHVWVANPGELTGEGASNASITEISASTGALVAVRKKFYSPGGSGPDAIDSDGTHVWVATGSGYPGSLFEYSATTTRYVGRIVQTPYELADAYGVTSDGTHVWVGQGSGLTEIDEATAGLVRVLSGPSFEGVPASDGTDVWVATADELTHIDASNGKVLQELESASYKLDDPGVIAISGGDVWVGNEEGNSVTEVDASTGALVRVISSSADQLDDPASLAFYDGNVWVSNVEGHSLTELSAATGALVRVIQLPAAGQIAIADGHLFVSGYDDLYELSASTGQTIKTLTATDDQSIYQMAAAGTDIWTGEGDGDNEVGEIDAATGQTVKVLSGSTYGVDPGFVGGIAADSSSAWVTNVVLDTLTGFPTR